MGKLDLGSINLLYPTPVTLVGVLVGGKPNIITIAHIGIIEYTPVHLISISMNKRHYSNAGIQENETFSINLPSLEMVEVVDFCGIHSGRNKDKGALFNLFYGKVKTAPMVDECPINMECKLYRTIDIYKHNIYIGEIVSAYCDDKIIEDGTPNPYKANPILFSFYNKEYWRMGERVATAWAVGKDFRPSLRWAKREKEN